MPCTRPLQAYRSLTKKTQTDNQLISLKLKDVSQYGPYETFLLQCGQCQSCRITRSRQWALRCVHEADQWEHNCFITLTYADEHLQIETKECEKCPIYKKRNPNEPCAKGSICKRDFQLFMKRLRKKFKGIEPVPGTNRFPIRYFHCGEYGEKLTRPHHHACVFNFQFPDRVRHEAAPRFRAPQEIEGKTYQLYTSKILSELWPMGYHRIGEVTWQSAAYVARYVTKKINGPEAAIHYLNGHPDLETGECYYIEPEYITMSRRPGIGAYWFNKYGEKQYEKDYITHLGIKYGIPSYYDKLLDKLPHANLKLIQKERRQRLSKNPETMKQILQRLQARETLQNQRFQKLMRSIENDPKNV